MTTRRENLKPTQDTLAAAFRAFILEAGNEEIREAIESEGEDPATLEKEARTAIDRALLKYQSRSEDEKKKATEKVNQGEGKEIREGLSTLVQLLRRNIGLSEDELAGRIRVESEEIRRIEYDLTYIPNPRTIYQLEHFFNLPERVLVSLSGAVADHGPAFSREVTQFAANAKAMEKLSRSEKKLLNDFVQFLSSQDKERKRE